MFLKFCRKSVSFSFCLCLCCKAARTGGVPRAAVCQVFTSSHLSPGKKPSRLLSLSHTLISLWSVKKRPRERVSKSKGGSSCSPFQEPCRGEAQLIDFPLRPRRHTTSLELDVLIIMRVVISIGFNVKGVKQDLCYCCGFSTIEFLQ